VIRPNARWRLNTGDPERAAAVAERFGLHPKVAELLVGRGLVDEEAIAGFLNPDISQLHDPMLMKGMPEAVRKIRQALDEGRRIRIYGDYDADGVSSTALMVHVFRSLGARFDYYIPDRFTEGYGLNVAALERAAQEGVELIVTVDNGISAAEAIAHAGRLGLDVVVTDHHEPPEVLPDIPALVNPKQADCPYPFKDLAGVGVAFKLAQALLDRVPEELTEFVALGTVADVMPLVGENRTLVAIGLRRMRRSAYPGIRALLRSAGIAAQDVTAAHIGFALGPRINASGRLKHASQAVACLITDEPDEAERLAAEMERLNRERQELVERMAAEAAAQLAAEGALDDPVLVAAGVGWNVGVVGIVAARLTEAYRRPSVVLSIDADSGTAKGSARSVPGFDLYAALTECAEWLDQFGGHEAAAGLTLPRAHIPELRRRLCESARVRAAACAMPEVTVDLVCPPEEATLGLIADLERLAPFGAGNEPPRILFPALTIREVRVMGKDRQHLKLVVSGDGEPAQTLDALLFKRGELAQAIAETSRIELLGELAVNEWNGRRKPQIIVHDLQVAEMQVFDWRGGRPDDRLRTWLGMASDSGGCARAVAVFNAGHLRAVEAVMLAEGTTAPIWTVSREGTPVPVASGGTDAGGDWAGVADLLVYSLPGELDRLETLLRRGAGLERVYAVLAPPAEHRSAAVPSRDGFKRAYAALLQAGGRRIDDRAFWASLSRHLGLDEAAVRLIVDVFLELGFLREEDGAVRPVPSPARKELSASARYRAALAAQECEHALLYSSAAELARWMRSLRGADEQKMEGAG
jgi:single-stranded-DNA-specific exonuclease